MGTILQHLENNEAILVMYLADELSAEERAEVERMLCADEMMRAELQQLQAVDELLRDEAGCAIAGGSLRLRDVFLANEIGRDIRHWQAAGGAASGAEMPKGDVVIPSARMRWWIYPAAAAAAVFLFLAWWGNNGEVPVLSPGVPDYITIDNPQGGDTDETAIATGLEKIEEATQANRAERVARLDDAENQLAALDVLSGSTLTIILDGLNTDQNQ